MKIQKLNKNGFPVLTDRKPYNKVEVHITKHVPVEKINLKINIKKDEYVPDLVQIIKSDKNLPDLFGPLKKTKIQAFLLVLQKVFKNADFIDKVPTPVVGILKNYAYIRQQKGNERKFIPNTNELIDIICCGYLYHISIQLNMPIEFTIELVERKLFELRYRDDMVNYIADLHTLIYIVNNQNLNQLAEDELTNYDLRVKYLRSLQTPSIDKLIMNILGCIAEMDLPAPKTIIKNGSFKKEETSFEEGQKIAGLIKKIGLRYINSRSNLEWYLFGTSLKKIRNFLGRERNIKFMDIVLENIKQFKYEQIKNSDDRVPVYKNIETLHSFLEKNKSQKIKNYKR